LAQGNEYGAWIPFGATIGVFLLAFYGLAYSLFPWLVIDRIHVWQGTISPESMAVILAGAVVVLPMIIGYTVFAYRVFWGKSTALKY
jgi:cytochrome d ubiquinol oxidase subunit II